MTYSPITGLSVSEWNEIKNTLKKYLPESTEIFVFGSRVRGDYKIYSDLDIALRNNDISISKAIFKLEEAFANSNLTFKVDISDFKYIDSEFADHIMKTCKKIEI